MSLPTLAKMTIVEALRTKFAALPIVGAAGFFDTAEQAEELADQIVKARVAGKFAVQFIVGPDAIGGENPERQTHHNVSEWEFSVGVVVYMPDPLPPVNDLSPTVRMRPDQAAHYIHTELMGTYDDDPTLGNLALWAECVGGGGAFIDPDARLMTDHAIVIRYRHPTGNPGVAA